MNVLLLGGGGRESAIALCNQRSKRLNDYLNWLHSKQFELLLTKKQSTFFKNSGVSMWHSFYYTSLVIFFIMTLLWLYSIKTLYYKIVYTNYYRNGRNTTQSNS